MEFKSYGIEAINRDPALEYLNESRIYADNIMYIGVFGDDGTNFIEDPYIKVYNNKSFTAADKVARIDLVYLKYVYHRDKKKVWYLNNKELKHLNKIVRTINPKSGILYWDEILIQVVARAEIHDYEYYKNLIPEIPDFTKVKR